MYVLQKLNRFVIPRTELTYPSHQLKMHENAAKAPVDHVMPDFEDACPYEFKGESSRNTMVEALTTLDFGEKVIAIRPNNIHSKYFLGDIEAIMLGAPDRFHGIILPKTEHAEDIVYLSKLLDALEPQGGWTTTVQIEALIETPLGVINAYDIAMASSRMAGLIFGIADFAASMGVRDNVYNQNQNFHYAKPRLSPRKRQGFTQSITPGCVSCARTPLRRRLRRFTPACARRVKVPAISAWTARG